MINTNLSFDIPVFLMMVPSSATNLVVDVKALPNINKFYLPSIVLQFIGMSPGHLNRRRWVVRVKEQALFIKNKNLSTTFCFSIQKQTCSLKKPTHQEQQNGVHQFLILISLCQPKAWHNNLKSTVRGHEHSTRCYWQLCPGIGELRTDYGT